MTDEDRLVALDIEIDVEHEFRLSVTKHFVVKAQAHVIVFL